MKTAVSIPNDVFEEAERLAQRLKRSRSDLYSRALREYLARHAPDRVTEAMNHAVKAAGEPSDGFVKAAARRTLGKSEW
jgi:metal-responsive CopG/Arc/MetJ family transcriptional regulator